MVLDGDGLYCEYNYRDIEFAYKMYHALYEKYPDKALFDKTWEDIYEAEDV